MWASIAFRVVFLGGALAISAPCHAQAPDKFPRADVEYTYEEPRSSALRSAYDRLTDRDVFAQIDTYLQPLRLPRRIVLRAKQCGNGELTEPYEPGRPLVLCYEYVQRVEKLLTAAKVDSPYLRDATVSGAIAHALLHLVSREIFHQLKLPVWGRAEDAADRLASFLMLRFGPEKAEDWYGGAGLYLALSGAKARTDYTDLSSPDFQRFFNHHCLAQIAGDEKFMVLSSVWTKLIMKPDEAAELQKFFDIIKLPPEQQDAALKALDLTKGAFASFYFKRLMGGCSKELAEVSRAFKSELLPYIDQGALTEAQRAKL